VLFGIVNHAAEFEDPVIVSALAYTLLPVEYRAAGVDPYRDGDGKPEWKPDNDNQDADEVVHHGLDQFLPETESLGEYFHERLTKDLGTVYMPGNNVEKIWKNLYSNSGSRCREKKRQDIVMEIRCYRDQELVDVVLADQIIQFMDTTEYHVGYRWIIQRSRRFHEACYPVAQSGIDQ